ncbi:MAG: PTS sugar transporter subunit IIA [Gemmataceae bacterium]
METLDIEQLAAYLSRDVREVGKLANRGVLPGRRVNGEWRFARAEINHWLEGRLHEYSEDELSALESAHAVEVEEPLLANLMCETLVAVPLCAATRSSVLRELVKLAGTAWQVYDEDAVLQAIGEREEMGSTALPNGVAIPHAHRPLGDGVLGEPLVAFGQTSRALPFGGPRGGLTDLFFLVLSKDDRTHLRVLARLARLMLREGLVEQLRAAGAPAEAYELIVQAERELLGREPSGS